MSDVCVTVCLSRVSLSISLDCVTSMQQYKSNWPTAAAAAAWHSVSKATYFVRLRESTAVCHSLQFSG